MVVIFSVRVSDGNFSTADANVSVACVDDGKLSGCDALDGVVSVDVEGAFRVSCVGRSACQYACPPAVGVANLEGHFDLSFGRPGVAGDEMEAGNVETPSVLQ